MLKFDIHDALHCGDAALHTAGRQRFLNMFVLNGTSNLVHPPSSAFRVLCMFALRSPWHTCNAALRISRILLSAPVAGMHVCMQNIIHVTVVPVLCEHVAAQSHAMGA